MSHTPVNLSLHQQGCPRLRAKYNGRSRSTSEFAHPGDLVYCSEPHAWHHPGRRSWMAQTTGAAFQSRAAKAADPVSHTPVNVSLHHQGCPRLRTKYNGRPRLRLRTKYNGRLRPGHNSMYLMSSFLLNALSSLLLYAYLVYRQLRLRLEALPALIVACI